MSGEGLSQQNREDTLFRMEFWLNLEVWCSYLLIGDSFLAVESNTGSLFI